MSIKPGYRKPWGNLSKYENSRKQDRWLKPAIWCALAVVSYAFSLTAIKLSKEVWVSLKPLIDRIC